MTSNGIWGLKMYRVVIISLFQSNLQPYGNRCFGYITSYMPLIANIMCRNCVEVLDSISNGMSEHMQEKFFEAVLKDMMTTDEEGMFYLMMFEIMGEQLKSTLDIAVMVELTDELAEEWLKAGTNGMKEIFQNEWS
tara:strand:- start:932 stop:1339 length:408 start_codon:yes stop_codon:yes gene_type:complete